MSREKEPGFFAFEGDPLEYRGPLDERLKQFVTTDENSYLSLFEQAELEKAVGESSVVYLYSETAPERIHRRIPDARLIVMLRNPVERAFSHFLDHRRHGREPVADFQEAIALENSRSRDRWEWSWRYVGIGYYARQLRRYLSFFDRDQMSIHLYEDFRERPEVVLNDLYRFLGVDHNFEQDLSERYNVSGESRSPWLEAFMKGSSPMKRFLKSVSSADWRRRVTHGDTFFRITRRKPTLQPDVRRLLADTYRDDVRDLQDLLHRDLSHWIEPAAE
jgi:hypothetical protein